MVRVCGKEQIGARRMSVPIALASLRQCHGDTKQDNIRQGSIGFMMLTGGNLIAYKLRNKNQENSLTTADDPMSTVQPQLHWTHS